MEIEEIALKEDTERKAAIASVEAKQSSAKKQIEAKDRQMFEKFTVKASGDMGEAKVNGDSGVSFSTTFFHVPSQKFHKSTIKKRYQQRI